MCSSKSRASTHTNLADTHLWNLSSYFIILIILYASNSYLIFLLLAAANWEKEHQEKMKRGAAVMEVGEKKT